MVPNCVKNNIYLLKVKILNKRVMFGVWSELELKTPERRRYSCSGFFIVNFEQISHIFFVVSIDDL